MVPLRRLWLRMRAFRRLPRRSQAVFFPALVLNPLFRLVAKRRGIKSATALARRLAGHAVQPPQPVDPTGTHTSLPIARQVVLGVRAAAGALPVELVCLPRSLTAWTILNRMGISATLRIGMDASTDHKTAHAWIDVLGEPIGEAPGQIQQMAEFSEPILGRT